MGRSVLRERAAAASLFVCLVATLSGCAFIEEYIAAPKVDSSSPVAEERQDPDDLAVGDCFNDPGEQYTFVHPRACDDAHTYEVFFTFDVSDGEFPGQDVLDATADERCGREFASFVGVEPEESTIVYDFYRPNVGTWITEDDRNVRCFVYRDGMDTEGSLRDADPAALRVGHCFDPAPDPADPDDRGESVVSVERRACDEPHVYEVYHQVEIESDERALPSGTEESAWGSCAAEYADFIGVELSASAYDFGFLYPSAGSWDQGDRLVTCYVFGDGLTTGSLGQIEARRIDS